jgi:hypothetical protein
MQQQQTDPSTSFEWTASGCPTTAVVTAVAEHAGEDPVELSPIYEAIDPDSLNDLFTPTSESRRPECVQFEYHGYLVVVRGALYEQQNARRDSPT